MSCTSDNVEAGTSIVVQIAANVDDDTYTYDKTTGTYYSLYSDASQPFFGAWSITATSAYVISVENVLTFRNITVPPNARIRKACIEFTSRNTGATFNSSQVVNMKIRGHKVANSTLLPTNSPVFYCSPTNFPRTNTQIDWLVVSNSSDGATFRSPDIGCVLQEIIELSGWVSGNAVKLFVEDNGSTPDNLSTSGSNSFAYRCPYMYGGSSTLCAKLYIWYTLTYNQEIGTNVNISINDDADDDCYYHIDNSTYYSIFAAGVSPFFGRRDTTATATYDRSLEYVLTFRNVTIPVGARIRKAVIEFVARAGAGAINTSQTVNAKVSAHRSSDSTLLPTNGNLDTSFPRTNAIVYWDDINPVSPSEVFSTPNISSVIQELIELNGWVSGNAVKLFVEDNNSVTTNYTSGAFTLAYRSPNLYSNSPSLAPKLKIWYTSALTDIVLNDGDEECFVVDIPATVSSGSLADIQSTEDNCLEVKTSPYINKITKVR